MGYQPVTPFRRMMDAALVNRALAAEPLSTPPAPGPEAKAVSKWDALRELSEARQSWDLSDRDMGVLQALLSFFPRTLLEGDHLIVFPSNAALCTRLNGMPLSTMRRHLARLVAAGVIDRRDSPNGKRYARRGAEAFGFDLSPLARQFDAFRAEADRIRADRDHLKRLRETVSLMRRDLAGLSDWGCQEQGETPLWSELTALASQAARLLRRKLDADQLAALQAELDDALNAARDALSPVEIAPKTRGEAADLSTSAAENERHLQDSNKDLSESEQGYEDVPLTPTRLEQSDAPDGNVGPRVPLRLVVSACPEAATYADRPIRHWHDLTRTAEAVRPMMGITAPTWEEAKRALGAEEAAIVLLAMLERFSDLRSPGGYLRTLARKANEGSFSSGPMVMALLRRAA
ncbi:replication initiation protein [Cereibacter sphaeroides]|nr:replication initiation protein [Cereibacter sphaeroides]